MVSSVVLLFVVAYSSNVSTVVAVILTFNSHNQVRGHRTGSSRSGAEEHPREKTQNKPKVVHAYIIADAIHASSRKIQKVESGVSLRCARSILVHTSHYSRLKKPSKIRGSVVS